MENYEDKSPVNGGQKINSTQSIAQEAKTVNSPKSTRNDLQISRRIFHFSTGFVTATLYNVFLSHQQVVYILGTFACVIYLLENIRISYPEISSNIGFVNKFLLRAEEQLKESSSVPYAMGILLTILTFPKIASLIAVLTLAISDPLSAVIGISFGKHKVVGNKSWEGSCAFFVSATLCALYILISSTTVTPIVCFGASLFIGLFAALLELIPLRIDDNLTIPLFTASLVCIVCSILRITL
jgi:dolichol kinase